MLNSPQPPLSSCLLNEGYHLPSVQGLHSMASTTDSQTTLVGMDPRVVVTSINGPSRQPGVFHSAHWPFKSTMSQLQDNGQDRSCESCRLSRVSRRTVMFWVNAITERVHNSYRGCLALTHNHIKWNPLMVSPSLMTARNLLCFSKTELTRIFWWLLQQKKGRGAIDCWR